MENIYVKANTIKVQNLKKKNKNRICGKSNKVIRNIRNIYSSTVPMANSVGSNLNNKSKANLKMAILTERVPIHFPMDRPITGNSKTDIFMVKAPIIVNHPIFHLWSHCQVYFLNRKLIHRNRAHLPSFIIYNFTMETNILVECETTKCTEKMVCILINREGNIKVRSIVIRWRATVKFNMKRIRFYQHTRAKSRKGCTMV